MAITECETLTFAILSKLNCYLWPFPVRWDFKASKLVFNETGWKRLLFWISLLYIWLFGWSFFGTSIYVGYIHQRKGFLRITWAIFISCGAICIIFCLMLYFARGNGKAILCAFNELVELADKISKGKFYSKKISTKSEQINNNSLIALCLYRISR